MYIQIIKCFTYNVKTNKHKLIDIVKKQYTRYLAFRNVHDNHNTLLYL